jgi:predicted secreted hydrolase
MRPRKTFCSWLLPLLALFVAGAAAGEWKEAAGRRAWAFPRDHGSHPEYRTEWWYFTGNLTGDSGARYGYELTFFRQGLRTEAAEPGNPWSVRDAFLAHFAITDAGGETFRFAERASRKGPGLAGAAGEGFDVRVLGWSAVQEGADLRLKARTPELELDLRLTPRKAVVLHGNHGLSRKGPGYGQASYYYSLPRLETRGTLRPGPGGPTVSVTGTSWFDHEFGSNQLTPEQEGWDWAGLHLSDGRDLMFYILRRKDGSVEPVSSGTLVEKDGSVRHLPLREFQVEALAWWRSPRTGARYPAKWRLTVRSAGVDLVFAPLLADQELRTEASTGIVYWEGAVDGRGLSAGSPVSCEGYVELTGYAGSLGGRF